MKPTHAINVTGRREFAYIRSHKTDVAATIRRWLREYAADWEAAYAEKAEREHAVEQEVSHKVQVLAKKAAR